MPHVLGDDQNSSTDPRLLKITTVELLRELIWRIGDNPKRAGLMDTPVRVWKSFSELYSGYNYNDQRIADMLKMFEEGNADEMVIEKDIPFYSMCEHHMLPFIGSADIAYIPSAGRILGLSKMARLLEVYARRLTVQERITNQVADAMMKHLKPKGAACLIRAEHLCMTCRGVNKAGAKTITSSLRGCFKDDLQTRSEFLKLVMGG